MPPCQRARLVIVAAIAALTGCLSDETSPRVIGEADFHADPSLRGTFQDVLVSWLEPPEAAAHAGDTGIAGEDRLPVTVARDEARLFVLEDASDRAAALELLDGDGAVRAEVTQGGTPAVAVLSAGDYTLVVRWVGTPTNADANVAIAMPLQSTVTGDPASTTYAPHQSLMDATSPANAKVLGDAPAIAMGNLFIATSQALADASHNATLNQPPAPGGGDSQVHATAVVIAPVAP